MPGDSKSSKEFQEHYSQDQLAATLEVLRYQHDFLYQTFHKVSPSTIPSPRMKPIAAQRRQSIRLPVAKKASTLLDQMENHSNSQYLAQMMLGRAQENKQKLQIRTSEAINKLSEYALKNPNFNHK